MADAMRRGEPVWAESVDALVARYPDMRSVRAALGAGAALAVPLVVDGRAVGAVSVWFREAVPIGEHDRTYLETVARLGAQALERARLYARAEAARREAEEANLAKTQFLATMSHELRTPLNAVIGHTDLLAMGLHGPVVPAQLEALVRVRKGGQFLLSMINDILNFARLESGRVELELADLPVADLLSDAEALVAPQFLSKGLSFAQRVIYRGPGCDRLAVRTDAEKTRQVLVNLLTNALKFTSAGGVTLECTLASSDTVAITVRDTGRGIPRAKLASIFEPFVQVDRHLTEGSQQGVGLGLSISRDLARLMGGDLTVESVVGVGSRFTLTLPRAPHAEASAAADERRQGAERRTDDRRTGLDRRHEGELRA
jgi:signal transduction histidine kinase